MIAAARRSNYVVVDRSVRRRGRDPCILLADKPIEGRTPGPVGPGVGQQRGLLTPRRSNAACKKSL